MSTVMATKGAAGSAAEMNIKLEFNKNLSHVTNKIHATGNVEEIMLDVSKDICALFNADRLTIYVVGDDNVSLVSKVKTGLNSFKDLKLPIAEQSIAGYAAMKKKLLNIKDVYDEKELAQFSPHLRFLQEVDKRTGYRTKQMLVVPVVDATSNDLVGIIQVINNKAGVPFAPSPWRWHCASACKAPPQKPSMTTWLLMQCYRQQNSNSQREPRGAKGSTSKMC